jgi:hypothetical protein
VTDKPPFSQVHYSRQRETVKIHIGLFLRVFIALVGIVTENFESGKRSVARMKRFVDLEYDSRSVVLGNRIVINSNPDFSSGQ